MILLEKAEPVSADGDRKSRPLPAIKKKKAHTRTGGVPHLPLSGTLHWGRPEERRQAALKEMAEKQAILEQRRKSQEAIRKWRHQAKINQEKKSLQQKKHAERRKREVAETDSKPGTVQASAVSTPQSEETRSPRELEGRIGASVEKMQERRRNPTGTTADQMAAAEGDFEEVRPIASLFTRLIYVELIGY
uniref:Uncharacterized protein n=1 Tax=Gasterosteus aculeatus TaxID=69293 RepID=G3NED3_GASAC